MERNSVGKVVVDVQASNHRKDWIDMPVEAGGTRLEWLDEHDNSQVQKNSYCAIPQSPGMGM